MTSRFAIEPQPVALIEPSPPLLIKKRGVVKISSTHSNAYIFKIIIDRLISILTLIGFAINNPIGFSVAR